MNYIICYYLEDNDNGPKKLDHPLMDNENTEIYDSSLKSNSI
ncbi:hypothetical protein FA11_1285 [Pelosinus fermentans A11]|uniref:Uncharacterized protein n=1 Tax=Pelosinus fermentans B4 TaxID=1149862 RepID=I8RAR5_9FIRM|nr:hypothetical protein FB4_1717 [Pelosinus fermentans B4]EIW27266.1 hypothetical protein FA11_1285 [Pelosinus fermentans A11]